MTRKAKSVARKPSPAPRPNAARGPRTEERQLATLPLLTVVRATVADANKATKAYCDASPDKADGIFGAAYDDAMRMLRAIEQAIPAPATAPEHLLALALIGGHWRQKCGCTDDLNRVGRRLIEGYLMQAGEITVPFPQPA